MEPTIEQQLLEKLERIAAAQEKTAERNAKAMEMVEGLFKRFQPMIEAMAPEAAPVVE